VLGGQFGSDKAKRLVVTLKDGDLIEFRPERTRRVVSMLAVDLFRFIIRSQTQAEQLAKARTKKAAIQTRRMAAKIRRADKQLSRGYCTFEEARQDCEGF